MEILENRARWQAEFEAGWLAKWHETGKVDWSIYNRPDNKESPAGRGIDLSQSRLVLISTAGGYLPASQEPFNEMDDLGDYSVRTFGVNTPYDQIAFAHTHYDHAAVDADPQVLLPLTHLRQMVAERTIGELAPFVISYAGYQPDLTRIVDDLIPTIRDLVREQQADGALLVPA